MPPCEPRRRSSGNGASTTACIAASNRRQGNAASDAVTVPSAVASLLRTARPRHGRIFCPETRGMAAGLRLARFEGYWAAKQYKNPAPPVAIRFCWLQPWLGCTEFQEAFGPPSRSK
jgi:hypothetical protein